MWCRRLTLYGLLCGLLEQVRPGGVQNWYSALVYYIEVILGEFDDGLPGQELAVECFGLGFFVDLVPDDLHVFDELGPELRVVQCVDFLELGFGLKRANHRRAVALLEEHLDQLADPVLHLDLLRDPLLLLQRFLKVLLGGNFLAIFVFELQPEVTQHPEQVGKRDVRGLCVLLHNLFGQVYYQRNRDQRVLVNASNAIVNQHAAEQQRQ